MMTFIEKVSVEGIVDLHKFEDAASLWRRKIEARRSLDWVEMMDDLVIKLKGGQLTTMLATVLDIDYNSSMTIALLAWYGESDVLSVFGIPMVNPPIPFSDVEIYFPVIVYHDSRTISPITSAYVTNTDDSGKTIVRVLAKVLDEHVPSSD